MGLLFVSNAIANLSGFAAGYSNLNSVDELNGFGVNIGFSFSAGLKISGGGNITLTQDGVMTRNACITIGVGISYVPTPYFEVKAGYVLGSKKFKIKDVMKWIVGKSKTYKKGGMKVTVKRNKKTIKISSNKLKRSYTLTPNKNKNRIKKIKNKV